VEELVEDVVLSPVCVPAACVFGAVCAAVPDSPGPGSIRPGPASAATGPSAITTLKPQASQRVPTVITAADAELGRKTTFIPPLYDDFGGQTQA
jgi:hypothetical protein